ncbi:MAG: thioredoxin family protein [Firmicutes bacterium]|nr:thioredoxin family protein [Bacillota bacterium]
MKLKIFYLEGCPYCEKAKKAVKELIAENPQYLSIQTEWTEERRNAEIAEKYDYYYVPSVFCGDRKLYECKPSHGYEEIKENINRAFKQAAE